MTYTEQYREYIECTFNGFCKTVLYHAAINAYQDLWRKQQHEVSLDYLREFHIEPTSTDEYFVVYDVPTVFSVRGKKVIVESEMLATALLRLPEKRREILLLRFACCERKWRHYTGYIKYLSYFQGHINDDIQDRLKSQLMEAIFKFRFDR